jgi:hypothetical protein
MNIIIFFLNNYQMYIYEITTIRQNIINALKMQLDDKNKIIDDLKIKNKIIDDLKMQLDDKNKIIDDLKIKNNEINKCSICLDNPISYCCIPCGHTYCTDCINKTNNCYICRGIISNKLKLYF